MAITKCLNSGADGERGEKQTNDEEKSSDVLYKGIAERTFERSFQLADHVMVKSARLANGLLHVDLVREVPEAMKPRAIPIARSDKVLDVEPTKVAARALTLKFGGAPLSGALSRPQPTRSNMAASLPSESTIGIK